MSFHTWIRLKLSSKISLKGHFILNIHFKKLKLVVTLLLHTIYMWMLVFPEIQALKPLWW